MDQSHVCRQTPLPGAASGLFFWSLFLSAKANEVKAHIDARVGNLLTALRREARARLYFDSGPSGTISEANATRFVVAKVTDGFIYPLNPKATERAGQLASLRSTHYLLIDAAEVAEGLITEHFNNLIEMANGHLRRIATEVNRQVEGGTTPAVTGTATMGTALPTRVLVEAEIQQEANR